MIKDFKILKTVFLTVFLSVVFSVTAFAGKAKIEFGDPTTTRGKNFELTLKVKAEDVRLKSADITISYDSEKITFNNGTKGTVAEGGAGTVRVTGTNNGVNTKILTYTLSFNAAKSGSTNVTILNNNVIDTNENAVNIIHEGKSTVTIKPANNSSKNANLKSLTISPGELDSEFNPDKFTYAAMVNFDVDKLNNISALAEDNDAVVTISGNENFKPGNNVVTITVTASNGTTKKTYTINVNKSEIGYSSGDTEVVSGVKLISKEFSVRVLQLPDDDDKFRGYYKTTPNIQNLNINNDVKVYSPIMPNNEPGDYFIFFGLDSVSQTQGYFRYDTIYNTIQRYIIEVNNQNTFDEDYYSDNNIDVNTLQTNYQRLLYLLIASLVIIVILITMLLLKNSGNRGDRDYIDEEDDEDDDYFKSEINRKKNVKSRNSEDYEEEDDDIEELI